MGHQMRRTIQILMALLLFIAVSTIFAGLNPRQVDTTESVVINAPREAIWRAVTDFEGTFHESNDAHISTTVTSRPNGDFDDGLTFLQVETVGGIRGVLDGHVYDVFPPERYRWSANTSYSVWGFEIVEISEGGDLRIEKTRQGEGWRVSHRVFGVFPDSVKGRVLSWFISAYFGIEADASQHTLTELEYVKREVESQ